METVDVITQRAAAGVFGLSDEAVRVATVQGHVRVALLVGSGRHPERLIEVQSARDYWSAVVLVHVSVLRRLNEATQRAVSLEVGGTRYRIIGGFIEMEPPCPHGGEWPCSKGSCSPLWWRWDERDKGALTE